MSSDGLSRRSALQRLARIGGAGVVVSVLGLIPEARALTGSRQALTSEASTPVMDAELRRLIDRAKAASEWSRFKAALVSEEPASVVRTPTGQTLIGFSLWDTDPRATQARREEPFQLLRSLTFGFAPNGESGAVLMTPSEDLTSTTVTDLRSSESKTALHSASAQATLAETRAKAIEKKRTRMALDGRSLELKGGRFVLADNGGCNCGTNLLYSCNQVITGGGYFAEPCVAICGLICGKSGFNWLLCWTVCYASCWVAPYSTCASYSCTMCAY